MSSVIRLLALAVTLVCSAATIAWAQEDNAPPQFAGRISAIEGRISMRAPDEDGWSEARVNYPVSVGMSFSTDSRGHAEMQFGGTTLRLDENTTVSVLALDENTMAFGIGDGSVNVRARALLADEEIVFEATHARVLILQAGSYRIDAGGDRDPTRVVAFEGRAEIETSRGVEEVRGRNAVEANAAGQVRRHWVEVAEIDDWAESRERLFRGGRSEYYVGSGTPGYEDLDRYGNWSVSGQFGAVWYPTGVPYGWQPYAYGHWAWIGPWGWTWIDDQPWGFAPFHYGRWVYVGSRWGWTPGERVRRPIYAPALVAFGGGDPWRFYSRNVYPDYWFPLAPGEIYLAPYTRNVVYLNLINRTNVRRDRLDRYDWRRRQDDNDFANNRHWRRTNLPGGQPRFDRRDPDRRDNDRDGVRRDGPRDGSELRTWQNRGAAPAPTATPPTATSPQDTQRRDDGRRDRTASVPEENRRDGARRDGPRNAGELRTWQNPVAPVTTPPVATAAPTATVVPQVTEPNARGNDDRRDGRNRGDDGQRRNRGDQSAATSGTAPPALLVPPSGQRGNGDRRRLDEIPQNQNQQSGIAVAVPTAPRQDGPRNGAELRTWQRPTPQAVPNAAPIPQETRAQEFRAPPQQFRAPPMPEMNPNPSFAAPDVRPQEFRAPPPVPQPTYAPPPPAPSASPDSNSQSFAVPGNSGEQARGPSNGAELRNWQARAP